MGDIHQHYIHFRLNDLSRQHSTQRIPSPVALSAFRGALPVLPRVQLAVPPPRPPDAAVSSSETTAARRNSFRPLPVVPPCEDTTCWQKSAPRRDRTERWCAMGPLPAVSSSEDTTKLPGLTRAPNNYLRPLPSGVSSSGTKLEIARCILVAQTTPRAHALYHRVKIQPAGRSPRRAAIARSDGMP